MMNRYVGVLSVLFLGLVGIAQGCSSAQAVCQLVCECEHCGDSREDATCLQYAVQEATAEGYECSDQWEAYTACFQEKGTCDEKEADFTTRGKGTCSDTQDLGLVCAMNSDCDVLGSQNPVTCTNGMCTYARCAGSGTPCTSDGDCAGEGSDLCADEGKALGDCISDASGGVTPDFF